LCPGTRLRAERLDHDRALDVDRPERAVTTHDDCVGYAAVPDSDHAELVRDPLGDERPVTPRERLEALLQLRTELARSRSREERLRDRVRVARLPRRLLSPAAAHQSERHEDP